MLRAAGSEHCTLLGALLTPDRSPRVRGDASRPGEFAVLLNTSARYGIDDDYPIGAPPEAIDSFVQFVGDTWGTLDFSRMNNPGYDDESLKHFSRLQRSSSTPRSTAAQYDYILRRDVRPSLPLIQSPTLVLHIQDNPILPIEHGQYLAEHIENATFVGLAGGDLSATFPDTSLRIIEFLTGERPNFEIDRVLTTIVFTDIVGSTERAAALGDRRWRALLDSHDAVVSEQLRLFRGREVKTTGDGFWSRSMGLPEPFDAPTNCERSQGGRLGGTCRDPYR